MYAITVSSTLMGRPGSQTLEGTQGKDLLFWANRYHLFVSWSSDRSHPWDSLAAASQYVTLEIGVKRGTTDKVGHLPLKDMHCQTLGFAQRLASSAAPLTRYGHHSCNASSTTAWTCNLSGGSPVADVALC